MKFFEKWKVLNAKDRIIYKNIIGAFIVKGASLIISLFTMPAYMRYFSNQEILGIWFTILSIMTWILNFDLGIGNGLRNKLSASLAQKDYSTSRAYVSSAYIMIGFLVTCITIIGLLIAPYVNWNIIFNVQEDVISKNILLRVVRVVYIGIMLQFLLRLVSSVLYAMQKSALNNLISLLISASQLMFVIVAPKMDAITSIQVFAVAYVFCANLPLIIATIVVFMGPMKKCSPSVRVFEMDKAKKVLSLGGLFFLCQILYMIIANMNEFMITQYSGPAAVVEYQVYNKLFSLGSTLFMLALTPIWSAVSKAVAEKDYFWIGKICKRVNFLSVIAICFEFLLVVVLQVVIDIWLGSESIEVNYTYALCFALFGSAMLYQTGISTIVNGIGRMKIQALCYLIGIVVRFFIIHFGMQWGSDWILIIFSNALILIPYCIIQQIDLNKYVRKSIHS